MIANNEKGQMAVELAIIMPVILAILVIAIDALVFTSECARFDQIAPQCILAHAVSTGRDEYDSTARINAIQTALDDNFNKNGSSVQVSCENAQMTFASMVTYTCTFKFAPWPFTSTTGPAVLEHSCTLSVDPYTPGELL